MNTYNNIVYGITAASELAYDQIHSALAKEGVDIKRDEIHGNATCSWVTRLMVPDLRNSGYPVYAYDASMYYRASRLQNLGHQEHYYVVARHAGKVVIANPSWTQFLDDDTFYNNLTTLPKVLIGSRQSVADYALEAGVGQQYEGLWNRALVKRDPYNRSAGRYLRSLINLQPEEEL